MPTIDITDDIAQHYRDPMQDIVYVVHDRGDTYANEKSAGDKLTHLIKELARLDFPYYFVEIITTNPNIQIELEQLHTLYSTEPDPLRYSIQPGGFERTVNRSDTICALPWVQKYVNPQGLVMPCCVADESYPIGKLQHSNLDTISTLDIRQQMLRGEKPNACQGCYKLEQQGLRSQRQAANRDWDHIDLDGDFSLRFIDMRLSNICNLMCRMCSGKFSNRIANEEEKLFGSTKYKNEVLDDNLIAKQFDYIKQNIHSLEQVYFAGGEPLINEEHYYMLDMLIAHKRTDVHLMYNTNFSILKFKQRNILDLWSKFDSVRVGASIDAIGPTANYVRHGVDYDKIEQNYQAIKDMPNVDFRITSTLHFMNVFNLLDLQLRWLELGLDVNSLTINVLTTPEEQSIRVLPVEHKQHATDAILQHIARLGEYPNSDVLQDKWRSAVDYMNGADDTALLKKFFTINDLKDSARKQNFDDYFPEYKNLRNY